MLLKLSVIIVYIYLLILFKLYRIGYLQSSLFDECQRGIDTDTDTD